MLIAFLMAVAARPPITRADVEEAERQYLSALPAYGDCISQQAVRLGGETEEEPAAVLRAAEGACAVEHATALLDEAAYVTAVALYVMDGGTWEGVRPEEADRGAWRTEMHGAATRALLEHRRSRREGPPACE